MTSVLAEKEMLIAGGELVLKCSQEYEDKLTLDSQQDFDTHELMRTDLLIRFP